VAFSKFVITPVDDARAKEPCGFARGLVSLRPSSLDARVRSLGRSLGRSPASSRFLVARSRARAHLAATHRRHRHLVRQRAKHRSSSPECRAGAVDRAAPTSDARDGDRGIGPIDES